MTTQVPYQHQQQPPAPAYPTTPPWATPPAAAPDEPPAPAYGAVTPWDSPYPQTGQLLVPYPEEMQNASRAEPPRWWPVIIWTFFFGVFGVVSAGRRAGQARRGRNSPAPYWVAWGVTLAVSAVVGAIVTAVAVPAYLNYRETAATKEVQHNIVADDELAAALRAEATTATCTPIGPRDANGIRRYDCVLSLDDGRTGSLRVTADSDGAWTAVPRTR